MSGRKPHFGNIIFITLVLFIMAMPERVESIFDIATDWFTIEFGWLVVLVCTLFLIMSILICVSKYGSLRLGKEDEKPQFSTFSWLAMLFASGMGSGLVFYGAAEPLMHFENPPPSGNILDDKSDRIITAMTYTYFHWGFHAWAVYAIAGLSVAYFSFRYDMKMTPGDVVARRRTGFSNKVIKDIANVLCSIAIIFGLVATMAQGVLQISAGMKAQSFISDNGVYVKLIILAAIAICYMLSILTGIRNGIKILSNINMVIAILLLLFFIILGPLNFIIDIFIKSFFSYFKQTFSLSAEFITFETTSKWGSGWTITYFLWWIAWAPFVGVFIARISRGRSLREFLMAVIIIPTIFSNIWFAVLGGVALDISLFIDSEFHKIVKTPEISAYEILKYFPFEDFLSYVTLLLMIFFLITSADSGAYVLSMFTSNGEISPSLLQRVFWGVIIAILTAGAIMTGRSTDFFRAFAVIGGIPYMFIMIWQSFVLAKSLFRDGSSAKNST